ncbi:hypothetical protein [Palleronia pontilimi]|uniref:hypothetical protein n=1 Tax=Palleronia pontilimi TaxID=1964209 RepID=UPI001F4045D3|nr:hypothetical protein [Palleronia pontilimi]
MPLRPFVPSDPAAAREYTDIIRRDFEPYIEDIQTHLRCLEAEHARAFEKARDVSEENGAFLEMVGQ